jgi:hypothetical protein
LIIDQPLKTKALTRPTISDVVARRLRSRSDDKSETKTFQKEETSSPLLAPIQMTIAVDPTGILPYVSGPILTENI